MTWGQVGGRKRRNHHQNLPGSRTRGRHQGHSFLLWTRNWRPESSEGSWHAERQSGGTSRRKPGTPPGLGNKYPDCARSWGRGLSSPRAAGRRGSAPHFGDRSSRQPPRRRTVGGGPNLRVSQTRGRAGGPVRSEGPAWAQPLGKRCGQVPRPILPKGPSVCKGAKHPSLPGGGGGVRGLGGPRGAAAVTPALPRCSSRGWGRGRARAVPRPRLQAKQRAAPGGQRAEDEPRRAGSLPAPRATRGRGARLPPSCRVSRCR